MTISSQINFTGSTLITPRFTKDLGHPIEQIVSTETGVLVLFKFGPGYDERMNQRNIVMIGDDGKTVWTVADSAPSYRDFRPYIGIQQEPEGFRLYTSFGADYRLDLQTGRVTLFDFSK